MIYENMKNIIIWKYEEHNLALKYVLWILFLWIFFKYLFLSHKYFLVLSARSKYTIWPSIKDKLEVGTLRYFITEGISTLELRGN